MVNWHANLRVRSKRTDDGCARMSYWIAVDVRRARVDGGRAARPKNLLIFEIFISAILS